MDSGKEAIRRPKNHPIGSPTAEMSFFMPRTQKHRDMLPPQRCLQLSSSVYTKYSLCSNPLPSLIACSVPIPGSSSTMSLTASSRHRSAHLIIDELCIGSSAQPPKQFIKRSSMIRHRFTTLDLPEPMRLRRTPSFLLGER